MPPEILYDDTCASELAQTGHVNIVRSYVEDNCDVPDDAPKVIFVGSLGAGNCVAGKFRREAPSTPSSTWRRSSGSR